MLNMSLTCYDDECHVLAHMMLNEDRYLTGVAQLHADDFSDEFNAKVFLELKTHRNETAPEVRALKAGRTLVKVQSTAIAKLHRICLDFSSMHHSAAAFAYHMNCVVEAARRRALLDLTNEITEMAYDTDEASTRAMDVRKRLEAIEKRAVSSDAAPTIGHDVHNTIERLDKVRKKGQVLRTGIKDLDEGSSFHPGESIVIAAATGCGKTAFALSILLNAAKSGLSACYATLEMQPWELHVRVLAGETGISVGRLFNGDFTNNDRATIVERAAHFGPWRLGFRDAAGFTVANIREHALAHREQHGLDILAIDYLQLLRPVDPKLKLYEHITNTSRDIKLLANELNCPVLILSQLAREGTKDSEPQLWHLKESGSIENDADRVIFLHKRETAPGEKVPRGGEAIMLKIAKDRRGPLRSVKAVFDKPMQRIVDVAYDPEDNQFNDAF